MNELTMTVKSDTLKQENSLEDEPMDTTELLFDGYEEEGEIHSSGDEQNDFKVNKELSTNNVQSTSIFGYSNAFDNAEDLKKMERAKRFAIPFEKPVIEYITEENLARLHKTLGIDKENVRHYRFNAIHMRGTQDMSTEDVLDYFAAYSPVDMEWINDVSCNVVWADDISAAKAMLNLSKEIVNLDKVHLNADPFEKDLETKEVSMDYSLLSDIVDAREIKAAIPPGFWRSGVPSSKSTAILLRFASRSDRKQKNAEKNSDYYKRYGNPHFGNLPGLVSQSLRSEVFKKYRRPDINEELDVEENENEKKNPWGHLAEEWNELDRIVEQSNRNLSGRITLKRQHHEMVTDLRSSINKRQAVRSPIESRCPIEVNKSRQIEEDDEDELQGRVTESRVKLPRMKMYADEEEKIDRKTNRTSSNGPSLNLEDLRNKINRKKRSKTLLSIQTGRKSHQSLWSKHCSAGVDDDGDYEDEKESSHWALEQYSDLRESLGQNKKHKESQYKRTIYKSDSEENDNDSGSDDYYTRHSGYRSPLQIEIENDEYFENESDNTL